MILKRILVGLSLLVAIVSFSQDKTYNNPIIPGYNPDPSVCRVGDDYYLVTSTFEYFPGVPIYHSKDLVNWKMIGHALHRPEQLDLEGVESTKGIFAPTIRYHKGVYYMITTFVTKRTLAKTKGNFIVTATNPEGPWSMPHWIKGAIGIDPSLFFDDNGKVYYCGHKGAENPEFKSETDIWIQEIDLETFQLKGEKGFLVSRPYFEDQTLIGSPTSFEAPHLYKKDGVYYLLIAHGGTSLSHAVSIWKSNSPLGPWEANPKNPILTHRDDKISGINATGHADVFQAKDGEWWSVFLGVRSHDGVKSALGRETFMAPVDWSGVWPIYNPNGEVGRTAYSHKAPKMFKGMQQSHDYKDDFKDTMLSKEWTMIRTPASKWWDLSSQSGKIKIQLRPDEIDEFKQPSFLGIRVPDQKTETQILVDFNPENQSECAGLALERGHEAEWTLVKELRNGKYVISAYKDGKTLLGQYELKTKTAVLLKIHLDNFLMSFYVKELNSSWKKIIETDASDLGSPAAGRFTGSLIGLFASSRGVISNDKWATFDDFELKAYTNN
jgi:alpha-N-arabinofuranosidase